MQVFCARSHHFPVPAATRSRTSSPDTSRAIRPDCRTDGHNSYRYTPHHCNNLASTSAGLRQMSLDHRTRSQSVQLLFLLPAHIHRRLLSCLTESAPSVLVHILYVFLYCRLQLHIQALIPFSIFHPSVLLEYYPCQVLRYLFPVHKNSFSCH